MENNKSNDRRDQGNTDKQSTQKQNQNHTQTGLKNNNQREAEIDEETPIDKTDFKKTTESDSKENKPTTQNSGR